jgi:hypothetical protein
LIAKNLDIPGKGKIVWLSIIIGGYGIQKATALAPLGIASSHVSWYEAVS